MCYVLTKIALVSCLILLYRIKFSQYQAKRLAGKIVFESDIKPQLVVVVVVVVVAAVAAAAAAAAAAAVADSEVWWRLTPSDVVCHTLNKSKTFCPSSTRKHRHTTVRFRMYK